ncbi:MAG: hypothetical protein ACYTFY_19305 [Planctomycetota bacterium]|jgi:hypothetical protein
MDRREFLKKSLKLGVGAGAYLTTGAFNDLFASEKSDSSKAYDLVAIKGGSPVDMFKSGMKEMGGMSTIVKKGQSVVVKPNIGWAKTPEFAANTNPNSVSMPAHQKFMSLITLVITGKKVMS